MTRSAFEDALMALLQAELGRKVKVDSLPSVAEEARRAITGPTVWAVYTSGDVQPASADYVQEGEWSWALLCLAKSYRSASAKGAAALELLEAVEAVVVGAQVLGLTVTKTGDQALEVGVPGIMGYQLTVSVPSEIRRV